MTNYSRRIVSILIATSCVLLSSYVTAYTPVAYDMAKAMEICDSIPLENPEGIWIYPDDNVIVLILKDKEKSQIALPVYNISVIKSNDVRLSPGDLIGSLQASVKPKKYLMTLMTERKKGILSRPSSCMAELSDEGETILVNNDKDKFKLRFSINPRTLLPGLWKVVSLGASSSSSFPDSKAIPSGMIKIYPSYDGNGSSRRSPRYL